MKTSNPPLVCEECLDPVYKGHNGHAVWYCSHRYGGTQVITKQPPTSDGFHIETAVSPENFERQEREVRQAREAYLSSMMDPSAAEH